MSPRVALVTGGGRGIGAACVQELFAGIGSIDVLVNNAGIASSASVERTTLDELHATFVVNTVGAFLCTRAALPGCVRGGGAGS